MPWLWPWRSSNHRTIGLSQLHPLPVLHPNIVRKYTNRNACMILGNGKAAEGRYTEPLCYIHVPCSYPSSRKTRATAAISCTASQGTSILRDSQHNVVQVFADCTTCYPFHKCLIYCWVVQLVDLGSGRAFSRRLPQVLPLKFGYTEHLVNSSENVHCWVGSVDHDIARLLLWVQNGSKMRCNLLIKDYLLALALNNRTFELRNRRIRIPA